MIEEKTVEEMTPEELEAAAKELFSLLPASPITTCLEAFDRMLPSIPPELMAHALRVSRGRTKARVRREIAFIREWLDRLEEAGATAVPR